MIFIIEKNKSTGNNILLEKKNKKEKKLIKKSGSNKKDVYNSIVKKIDNLETYKLNNKIVNNKVETHKENRKANFDKSVFFLRTKDEDIEESNKQIMSKSKKEKKLEKKE